MLKAHFKQSQFLVVSRKAYYNANMLFRTKWATPGVSTITGHVNVRLVRTWAEISQAALQARSDLARGLLLCATGKATLKPLRSHRTPDRLGVLVALSMTGQPDIVRLILAQLGQPLSRRQQDLVAKWDQEVCANPSCEYV